MNLLGIDTATAASAVCVLRDDGAEFEVEPTPERLGDPPGHAAELMPAIADCLGRAGLGWGDLDAIGVGVGPGTFTGLRIGVTTARALAHATGVDLRPISSLEALAAGVHGPGMNGTGPARETLALIDARRGEVFAALYDREGGELWEPFAATPEAIVKRVREEVVAPKGVGDGAIRFMEVFQTGGVVVPPIDFRAHVIRGSSVCRLALTAPPVPVDAVIPEYLRLPDAKPRTT